MSPKKLTRKEKARQQAPVRQSAAEEQRRRHARAKTTRLLGLLVAALAFGLYVNTLGHDFVLDDYSVIKENRLTRQGWDAFPEIFTKSYRFGYYFVSDELYRPLPKALFAVEWALFPDNPAPGHWLNVLLYALTGFVLFRVLLRYSGHRLFAFLAALLFVAHPVHTEVVANIKSSDELFSLLFILLALAGLHRYTGTGRFAWLGGAMGCYLLSLFSKESGITFVAVFPLWLYFFNTGDTAARVRASAAMAAAAAIFLLVRHNVLAANLKENFALADNLLMGIHDPVGRFATAVAILGIYLKQLVFPHPLVFDKSFNQIEPAGIGDWRFLVPFLLLAAVCVIAVLRFRRRELPVLGAWYFLLTMSIFSNVFVIIGTSYGERLLYLPSLGFCLVLAWLLTRLGSKAGAEGEAPAAFFSAHARPLALCAVLVAAYAVKTVARNTVWKDNLTLFSHDVLLSPNSTRTHYYLGNYMTRPENIGVDPADSARMVEVLDSGIVELKKAIAIYPRFCDVYKQLGVAYGKKSEKRTAFEYYKKAIECNPSDAPSHSNIGTIYFEQGNYREALKAFHKAIELDPNYTEALLNLGSSYGMLQDYPNSLKYLHRCIETDPGYVQAYYFLSLTYGFMGDSANKALYLEKYRKLGGKS